MDTHLLPPASIHEMLTEFGAMRADIKHLAEDVAELRAEIAQNRKPNWTAIGWLTGTALTGLGALGGLMYGSLIAPIEKEVMSVNQAHHDFVVTTESVLKEKASIVEVNRITSEIIARMPPLRR